VQQADFYLGIIVLVLFALGIYLLLKPRGRRRRRRHHRWKLCRL